MSKRQHTIQQLTLFALFVTFASVLSYLDALLPLQFLPLPGVKLGLANLVILLSLYLLHPASVAAISLARILLIHLLLFPSPNGLLLSLCGACLSFGGMLLFKKLKFPVISVSIFGSICHNLGQALAAVLLLQTPSLFLCLFWLLPLGTLCGALIGLLADILLKRMHKLLPLTTQSIRPKDN